MSVAILEPPGALRSPTRDAAELDRVAHAIRHRVIDLCGGPEGGHLGGSLSAVDILTVLYFSVLRVDPTRPAAPDRDIFLLSKGHAAVGLYATLATRGYFSPDELDGFGRLGSCLGGHPTVTVPGVEMPSGSLGHGLALGLGFALGARLSGRDRRVFVLLGDGELQEGSCWEAAAAASAAGADRLVAIVDRNRLQQAGDTEQISPLEPLADRWRAFGWAVTEVDGHDRGLLRDVLDAAPRESGRPSVVIAHTVKGRGVAPAEGRVSAHYAALSARAVARAHADLDAAQGRCRRGD